MFYNAIKAVYPDMTIISSSPALSNAPDGVWLDYHRYDRPDHLVGSFNLFDNWSRRNPVLVGEMAIVQANAQNAGGVSWGQPQIETPNMISAVAEAIFMMGCERNADLVKGETRKSVETGIP